MRRISPRNLALILVLLMILGLENRARPGRRQPREDQVQLEVVDPDYGDNIGGMEFYIDKSQIKREEGNYRIDKRLVRPEKVQAERLPSGTIRVGYYIEEISMPKEHQKYLYKLCREKGLDYIRVMGLIKNESNFQQDNISSTNDYGYMQINICNHKSFSQRYGTRNQALDPYINLLWGTSHLADLEAAYRKQGKTGRELYYSVLSAYNKGITGFKNNGYAQQYIERTEKRTQEIREMLLNKQIK